MVILETKNLKKYYGTEPNIVRALDNTDITVENGEFITIMGMSGSGKSTLLHLIGGLDTPTDGNVIVDSIDINGLTSEQLTEFRRDKVGFIFQNFNLIPILSVYENIVLPIELGGNIIDESYIDSIVQILNINDKRNAMPNELSGGQQQRVAIARALATKPAIILADEPTGNLDTKTSQNVLELLINANKEFNKTIILVTHNESIAQLSQRTVYIEDGKIS